MDLPSKSWDPQKGDWSPNCDFLISGQGIVVLVELARIRSTDLDITFEGNRIQVVGNRSRAVSQRRDQQSSGDVKFGQFHVLLDFPAGYDIKAAKAAYVNGFLRIDVPAAESTSTTARFVP